MRVFTKKRIRIFLFSVVLLVLISGCGFIEEGINFIKGTKTDKISDIESTIDVLNDDNSITLGIVELDTYNPLTTKSPTMKNMLGFIFEPLFTIDNAFKDEGVLAKGYQISPDGKSIRITLKDNVFWHDGTLFTANDVVYTINTILKGDTNYCDLLKNVISVSMTDNYTVNVKFNRSTPNPVALMTFPIIKNGSINEPYRPIGTGAFYFDYDKLTAYTSYHGVKPNLEKIKIKSIPDNDKFISLFNASVIDVADSYLIDMNEYTPRSNAQVYDFYSNEMVYIGFNAEDAVFKYTQTRRSVSAVINRRDIASHVYFSRATAVNYPLNPEFKYYPINKGNLSKDEGTVEKILKDADWKKDKKGTYFYSDNIGMVYFNVQILVNADDKECLKTASKVSDSMTDMGMKNTIVSCSETEFNSRIANGNYNMFIGKTQLLPNNDLTDLLSRGNIFNYSDTETDILLSQIGTLTNEEDKAAIYDKLFERVKEQCPIAPICFLKESLITSAKIKSGVVTSISGSVRNVAEWSVK